MPYFTNRGITPLPTAAAYAGPGDQVTGALGWWGLRAYNAAYATGSQPALDLDNNAGSTVTINILSTGFLDTVTAAPLVGTHRVSKLYDQTGNGRHLLQATHVVRPALDVSGTPFILWDSLRDDSLATSGTITQAQPLSYSMVVQRVTNFTTQQTIIGGASSAQGQTLFASSTDTMAMYSGSSVPTFAATDAAFHAVQTVFDNAVQSIGYVDGTSTNVSLSASGGLSVDTIKIGNISGKPDLRLREVGLWAVAFNGTQMLNLNTNQHGTSGWNF